MLHRIALLAIAMPRRILAVAALLLVAAAVFGVPVAKNLSAGGFQDPGSESARAAQLLTDKFGQGDMQMLVTVSSPRGAIEPGRLRRRQGRRRSPRAHAAHRRRHVGLDVAPVGGADQQGRHGRPDRRGCHRR